MGTAAAERDKAFVLEAFDTLVNRRDYTAAQRFWSPDYMQHSAHIPPGREGLFNLVKGQQDHSGHRAPAKRADRRTLGRGAGRGHRRGVQERAAHVRRQLPH
jgi:hypothetical protein